MKTRKFNSYGAEIFFEPGDSVRIWKVYKRPVGTIERVSKPDDFPIKYLVRYRYFDGTMYEEEFESIELTLVERFRNFGCNCESVTDRHADWCNRTSKPRS